MLTVTLPPPLNPRSQDIDFILFVNYVGASSFFVFSTFHSNVRTFVSSALRGDRSVDLGVRRGFLASCRLCRKALSIVFLKHLVRVDNGLEI